MTFPSASPLLAALVLAVGAAPALAGSISIAPVSVQMIGKERTATMTIRNAATEPVNLQVRTVDWSQPEGADVYAPAANLLASPPVVQLAAGESQTIRLVIQNTPSANFEQSYRLILDEIPSQASTRDNAAGVQTAIRALVPVFLTPSTNSHSKLRWTAGRSGGGVVVTAYNDGDSRERISGLTLSADGKALGGGAPLEGYVLSHGKRSWTLPDAPASATSIIAAGSGIDGAVEAHVRIAQ